jgi:hypothetical protein
MHRSKIEPTSRRRRVDIPAWIALGWVVWFGALYLDMIIRARGGIIADWLSRFRGGS